MEHGDRNTQRIWQRGRSHVSTRRDQSLPVSGPCETRIVQWPRAPPVRELAKLTTSSRPTHVITMLRPRPGLPPWHASFRVPLSFNKLEFRDYLYNVYNVEVSSVRSMVVQRPGGYGERNRPLSDKIMHVTLVKPFVWPAVPRKEDLQAFDKGIFDTMRAAEKKQEEKHDRLRTREHLQPLRDEERQPGMEQLSKHAKDLLSGKVKWRAQGRPAEAD
jgi:large subunit ribosomal protein L23